MNILNYDEIFKVSDLKTKDIFIKEWKGCVTIQELSAHDRCEFSDFVNSKDVNNIDFMIELLSYSCIDEKKNKLFGHDDMEWLGGKSTHSLALLFNECCKINDMGVS